MTLEYNCPSCSRVFQADPAQVGQEVACPSCQSLASPSSGTTSPPPAPQQSSMMYPPGFEPPTDNAPPVTASPVAAPPTSMPSVAVPPSSEKSSPPISPQSHRYPPGMSPPPQATAPPSPSSPTRYPPGFEPPAEDAAPPISKPEKAAPPFISEKPEPTQSEQKQPAKLAPQLPPASLPPSSTPPAANSPRTGIEALLPPGATTMQPSAEPDAQESFPEIPSIDNDDGTVMLPTGDGGFTTLHEPVKTVGEGKNKRELRRISSEKKDTRRTISNVVMWGFCVVVLIGSMILLMWLRG